MIRALLSALASGLLLLFIAGNAVAATITYQELYNPTDILMSVNTSTATLNWTFDITDNTGWSTPGQQFNAGTITLMVADDGGPGDGDDKATFTFEAGTGMTNQNINAAAWSGIFSVASGAFSDGLIFATLTATSGDFWFSQSELKVTSEYSIAPGGNDQGGPTPVPEPSTMVLLGSGLLGLLYVGRRKSRK